MDVQATALVLAWITILVLAFAVAGLTRQMSWLLRRASGGELVGSAAPAVGTSVAIEELPEGLTGPRLLLFVDNQCSSCRRILAELPDATEATPSTLDLAVLFPEESDDVSMGTIATHANQAILFQRLRIPATPYAVIIDAHRRVTRAEPIGSTRRLQEVLSNGRISD